MIYLQKEEKNMFDDDFFGKTSEALNGFFESIEKSIKGLQKDVDEAKDKMMKESAEGVTKETAEGAKTEASDAAEKTGEAQKDAAGVKKENKPFEDWFNKAREAVNGIMPGANTKPVGIAFYRADTKETVNIFCELPGCDKKDVSLNYEKDMLVIRAKKNAPAVEGIILFKENTNFIGSMEQKIRVGKLDAGSIRASYKDGVLKISCKRPAESASGINID